MRLFLPDGGVQPDEPPEDTLLLIERLTTACEHEIIWLPGVAATVSLARDSDAWAIARACAADVILRQG